MNEKLGIVFGLSFAILGNPISGLIFAYLADVDNIAIGIASFFIPYFGFFYYLFNL